MPSVQKVCEVCGHKAKRRFLDGAASTGCRGIHETASEEAWCPLGHGEMVRVDGLIERVHADHGIRIVTGRKI
jgi:hypothetical protein